MTDRRSTTRALPRATGGAVAILVIALSAAWLSGIPGTGAPQTGVWRGYETLLMDDALVRAGGVRRVVDSWGTGVVSDITAAVTFWEFTGIRSVPLEGLDARIDPSDPRHDKVLDEIGKYFNPSSIGGRWTALYIPARRAPVLDYLALTARLGPLHAGAWRLVDFDPLQAFVGVGGLLGFAFLLARNGETNRRERLAVAAAGALIWIPFVLGGGLARLALCFLLLAGWRRATDVVIVLHGWDDALVREMRDPLLLYAGESVAGLLVLLPSSAFSFGAVVAYACPVVASALLIVALALYWGKVKRPRRRKKFEPVPIVKPIGLSASPGKTTILFVICALLLSALVPLARAERVPTPIAVRGSHDFSWRSIGALSVADKAGSLPDMSDIVTHEAFQETIAFGRPWGAPRQDERVYVREYLTDRNSGNLVEVKRRVKVFDAVWLRSAVRGRGQGSIEGMLLAQGKATAVGVRSSARPLVREMPVALLVVLLFWAPLIMKHAGASVAAARTVRRAADTGVRKPAPGARRKKPVAGSREAAHGRDTRRAGKKEHVASAPPSERRERALPLLMRNALLRFNGAARRNQTP